jgi:GABA(A) receptor-associated protein
MEFKKQYPLYQRIQESQKVLYNYPDKVPVICEKDRRLQNCGIKKRKYLVSRDLTIGQFIFIIRNNVQMRHDMGLFLFTNGIIPSSSDTIEYIYNKFKDNDGFLYINYAFENTFG